jgi:hypothetical protein
LAFNKAPRLVVPAEALSSATGVAASLVLADLAFGLASDFSSEDDASGWFY